MSKQNDVLEIAKQKMMKKHGISAEQAERAIAMGFKKLKSMLPSSEFDAHVDLNDAEAMDESVLMKFRDQARSALARVLKMKSSNGDGIERVAKRNKYV